MDLKETNKKGPKWWLPFDAIELTLLLIMALAMAVLIILLIQM